MKSRTNIQNWKELGGVMSRRNYKHRLWLETGKTEGAEGVSVENNVITPELLFLLTF